MFKCDSLTDGKLENLLFQFSKFIFILENMSSKLKHWVFAFLITHPQLQIKQKEKYTFYFYQMNVFFTSSIVIENRKGDENGAWRLKNALNMPSHFVFVIDWQLHFSKLFPLFLFLSQLKMHATVQSSFARFMSSQGFDTWVLEVRGAGLSALGVDYDEGKQPLDLSEGLLVFLQDYGQYHQNGFFCRFWDLFGRRWKNRYGFQIQQITIKVVENCCEFIWKNLRLFW